MIFITLMFNLVFAAANTREWMKLPLREGEFFREVIPKPAESFFLPTERLQFLPPVAYMERQAQGDEKADRERIRLEVLNAVGVNAFVKSTIHLDDFKPFKAGEKLNLPATMTLVQSADGDDTRLTCFAIIRDGQLLRVIYTSGWQAAITDCRTPFLEIARSPALTLK